MKTAETYIWKAGYRVAYLDKVPADVFGARLEQIRLERGPAVTATDIVDDARPADSALHALFEWDDAEAAEQYRLHQGRKAMNSLRVVRVVEN